MTALLVTGTGPRVGATVVTAAVAALALDRGASCTVVKPAQTGRADGEPGDLAEVVQLAGEAVRGVELARYPDELSPAAAARRSGRPPVDPATCVQAVLDAERDADLVLVDASGGLLVRYDDDGWTVAELARALRLPVLVVAGTGGLNAAALTLEAVAHRGLDLSGIVLGSWPRDPGPLARSDVRDLEVLAARPLVGALAEGAGAGFLAAARAGLGPSLGGTFDATRFRHAAAVR